MATLRKEVPKPVYYIGLRDELLEILKGLAQAARRCKSADLLDAAVSNKLISLDYAYNVVRHITTQHVAEHVLAIQCGLTRKAEEKSKKLSPVLVIKSGGGGNESDKQLTEKLEKLRRISKTCKPQLKNYRPL